MLETEYYRFLASTLPPAELGAAVLRRIRRVTVRRVRSLFPNGGTGPAVDLVSTLHLKSAAELAERMREHRAARGPIEPNERAEARHQIETHLPSYAGATCDHADRVLSGELFLFGRWREHSSGVLASGIAAIDWRRDPLHGGVAPDVSSRDIDYNANGFDARAIWEAGRCAHILWLAQAHVLVGLPGTEICRGVEDAGLYARAAGLHIRDFLATQPVGRGIHWTCPMEVALRTIHIALALTLLRDAPELDPLFWSEVGQSLLQHGRFIANELEDSQAVPGNHLLTDLAGLAVLGCLFPELPGAMGWRGWSLAAFSRELLRQTSIDGLSFEASLPYHRFATELGLLVHALTRREGLALGRAPIARLWKMCDVVEAATLADGKLANIGDNDATRAVFFSVRSPLDTRHIPALKVALGGPGVPASIEPEALWLGGLAGLRRNIDLSAPRLAQHLHEGGHFSASGLTVLRGDRGRSATLWAGTNGQHGLGGHAHNDKLSSEIVLGRRRWVVDPGCPTYLADPDERNRYRSTAEHPTAQVDEQEQSPIQRDRLFLLPDVAHARVVKSDDLASWAEHVGYARMRPPVVHRREVIMPAHVNAVCVTDWLLGSGAHVVDIRWPLSTRDVSMRNAAPDERALLERLDDLPLFDGRLDLSRVFVMESGAAVAVLSIACDQPWEATLVDSIWSPGYGERVAGRTIRIRVRAECPMSITSAFSLVRDS